MTENQPTPARTGARPDMSRDPEAAPHVRRPDEHIRRPRLRVKRKEAPEGAARTVRRAPEVTGEEPRQAAVETRAATVAPPEPAAAAEPDQGEPVRHVPPPAGGDDPRFRYATYRSAPADEPTPKRTWLAALLSRNGGREVSTGFVLGLGLVLVVLIGGIWISRLSRKVSRLEQRLVQLEEGVITTADAGDLLP